MSSPTHSRAGAPIGEIVFAVVVVVGLGVFALVRAAAIPEPVAANGLGPRTLPYLVGSFLLLVGVATLVGIARGHRGEPEGSEDLDPHAGTSWLTVGTLIALFVVHTLLIVPLGWPIAAAVLFIGAAISFGARPWWKAAIGGLVLAFLVQAIFAGLLSVSLPAGPLLEGLAVFGG